MGNHRLSSKWAPLILTVVVALILFWVGWQRLTIDSDIVGTLPLDDPVLSDAAAVVKNHPMQDLVVIDLQLRREKPPAAGRIDPEPLAEAATFIEQRLVDSGLFRQVGTKRYQELIPLLLDSVTNRLPLLFTERQLTNRVAPLLQSRRLQQQLEQNIRQLLELQGVGQADRIAADPLGLRNLVMARLAHLSPARGSLYRGQLLSPDRRHVLLLARPAAPGTDTALARQMAVLFQRLQDELDRRSADQKLQFTLTTVGAWRAALDNENIVRSDVQRLILFAALGIIILLVLAFPRPAVGFLALLPAVAGTLISFFLFSLWHESISILTIGFGGAIISISVDHGIAYLLFLDRPDGSTGRQASREVWSVGLLAALTTVGAFASLQFSGFSVLAQIGQFAAFGIAASFLFVHLVFPLLIPQLPPVRKKKGVFLHRMVPFLFLFGGKYKAWAALGFGLLMAAFARPGFNADFRTMNTILPETAAAENKLSDVWGDIGSRVFVMAEADSLGQLQQRIDRLTDRLQQQVSTGSLAPVFTPSMLFPGQSRARENLAAWQAFWNEERKSALRAALAEVSQKWGFTPTAFRPFLRMVEQSDDAPVEIPAPFFDLLGIQKPPAGGPAKWAQFATLQPGESYRAAVLFEAITRRSGIRVFDPAHFSVRLGQYLADTFLRMAAIVGISVVLLVCFFFFDWQLAAAALLPVAFALSCTLGTLRIIGHPLDIPGLMLSIVVMGMGIDYTLYLVRGYQRYRKATDPLMILIQTAVFLAAVSTLIGFGTLNFARHHLLQSAGLTCVLGVGYAFLGAFLILPPLLQRIFSAPAASTETPAGAYGSPQTQGPRFFHQKRRDRIDWKSASLRKPYYQLLIMFSRRWGTWIMPIFIWPVTAIFFFLFPRRVAVGIDFYRSVHPDRSRVFHLLCVWRQYHRFSRLFVDRFYLHEGIPVHTTSDGWQYFEEALATGTGGIVLMSHMGTWEMAAGLIRQKRPHLPLLLYMGKKHQEKIGAFIKDGLSQSGIRILTADPEGGSPLNIIEAVQFLREGGLVSLTGDRTWSGKERTVPVTMFGREAKVLEAPHVLSLLSGAPILVFFSFRTGPKQYHMALAEPYRVQADQRSQRNKAIRRSAQHYADHLERNIRRYPLEWFHFDSFLGPRVDE
jgi:predicted exporter/predicted LPLAT superfamily acyltransferase